MIDNGDPGNTALKIVRNEHFRQGSAAHLRMHMYAHVTPIRVRYAETDQMGYVYYGRYAEFFEVGRVEALRAIGFPYRQLEEAGVRLPVHDLHVKYHKP